MRMPNRCAISETVEGPCRNHVRICRCAFERIDFGGIRGHLSRRGAVEW